MIAEASNAAHKHAQAAQLEPSCSRITLVSQARWSPSSRGVTASSSCCVAVRLCACVYVSVPGLAAWSRVPAPVLSADGRPRARCRRVHQTQRAGRSERRLTVVVERRASHPSRAMRAEPADKENCGRALSERSRAEPSQVAPNRAELCAPMRRRVPREKSAFFQCAMVEGDTFRHRHFFAKKTGWELFQDKHV